MPAAKLAKKAQRSSARKRNYNKPVQSLTKTNITKARVAIANGDVESAREAVKAATRSIDVAAQKNVLHSNNAARRKSRLMKLFNQMKETVAAK